MPEGWARPVRLLLLHHEEKRLLAGLDALTAAGFAITGAGCAEAAARAIVASGPPDALLTRPHCGGAFARAALVEYPQLAVFYLVPRLYLPERPCGPREHLLSLPFTAGDLAAALAAAGVADRHGLMAAASPA